MRKYDFDWHGMLKELRDAGTVEALWSKLQSLLPAAGLAHGTMQPAPPPAAAAGAALASVDRLRCVSFVAVLGLHLRLTGTIDVVVWAHGRQWAGSGSSGVVHHPLGETVVHAVAGRPDRGAALQLCRLPGPHQCSLLFCGSSGGAPRGLQL